MAEDELASTSNPDERMTYSIFRTFENRIAA